MTRLLFVLFAAAGIAAAQRFPFSTGQSAEVVAELEMSSPGADWGEPGREAAVANVLLDAKPSQNVMLFAGARRHTYRVFLGLVGPGDHELTVERNAQYSARPAGLTVHRVSFQTIAAGDPFYEVLSHAPVLFARQNTVGKFTDVPLLMYCERLDGELQYTVIFSNEDGGTSTRALMARWGRTTDIEFIYRVKLAGGSALIQSRNHKELPFEGQKMENHPLLIPVTDNNMVSGEATSPLRYQLAPVLADLRERTRESVMDAHPFTYEVASKELKREGKLRAFGVAAGENVSDLRNYLSVEYRVENSNSAVAVGVRRKGEEVIRRSNLGRLDYSIDRDGWVRTTVELPPGTTAESLSELVFYCDVAWPKEKGEPLAHSGACRVPQLGRVFLLDREGKPGANLARKPARAIELRTGESYAVSTW